MSLNDAQLEALLAPLSPGRVRSLDGNSHLEAWDVRRWLLRIFGWGGWALETLECALVSERSAWDQTNPLKGRHTVVYRVQVRLIIKDSTGAEITHFDDAATGDGINQPSLQKAHDFAVKSAMSQALKRCAVNLGDSFGLSLYDRGKAGETTVGRSLAHTVQTDHAVREDVGGGELDEQRTVPETADTTSDIVSAPPPAPAQSPSPPLEGAGSAQEVDPAQVAERTAARVSAFRDEVIAALKESRREAAKILARLSVRASQDKIMTEPTHSPLGEPMTVATLLDSALKHVARDGAPA